MHSLRRIRMRMAAAVAASLLSACFLFCRLPSEAWSYHTHRKIVSDAVSYMPTEFQNRFIPFKALMMKGATDPDTELKDFMNHVFHVHSRTGHDSVNRIRDLFQQAADQLRQGTQNREAAYTMGLLAHYVADINQPLHTAGSDGDAAESDYHSQFEKDIQSRMTKIPVPVPGEYRPVVDPAARVREMAEAASRYYERIGRAYRTGNNIFDVEDIVNEQYAAAVRQVADYWLGIMTRSGQSGIPVPPPLPAQNPASAGSGLQPGMAPFMMFSETSPAPQSSGPVDINTAPIDQLMNIPGIGEKRAQAIITARRIKPFTSIRDLMKLTFPNSGKKAFNVNLIDRLSGQLVVK